MHNCKIPSHARSIPPVPLFALARPLPSSFLAVQNTTLKRDLNTSTTNNIIEEKVARIQEREKPGISSVLLPFGELPLPKQSDGQLPFFVYFAARLAQLHHGEP